MATQDDKERNLPPADPISTGNAAKSEPVEGKDPDLYDPVGMAGKKGGIVQEIEQQLVQEGSDGSKEIPAGETASQDQSKAKA